MTILSAHACPSEGSVNIHYKIYNYIHTYTVMSFPLETSSKPGTITALIESPLSDRIHKFLKSIKKDRQET